MDGGRRNGFPVGSRVGGNILAQKEKQLKQFKRRRDEVEITKKKIKSNPINNEKKRAAADGSRSRSAGRNCCVAFVSASYSFSFLFTGSRPHWVATPSRPEWGESGVVTPKVGS